MHSVSPRSLSYSPLRNHELLKEVVQARHEFSKQQCEHQHYISGLRYRLEKETHNAIHTAEAEKFRFEFEIKGLEEELDARSRICKGEEERMVMRRDAYDNEIQTLSKNLDQSQHLIDSSKEQMAEEQRARENDFNRMMDDMKNTYEKRIESMRDDYDKALSAQKQQIAQREEELESKNSVILKIILFSL